MGVLRKIQARFAALWYSGGTDKVAASQGITNNIVAFLVNMSKFNEMAESAIYEQLYVWESEIGGAIDRMSTMVGQAYKEFYIKDTGEDIGTVHEEMVREANRLADEINVRYYFEMFTEILLIHGNLYLEKVDELTWAILPNDRVTIIDRLDRLEMSMQNMDDIITVENYLVVNEGNTQQRVIGKDKFIHVKYKSTPVYATDTRGRTTYGVYAVSPLHRVVLPVWWKRQAEIIDILWRWRNVPKEHHSINADMFSLDKYVGTPEQKRTAAKRDAQEYCDDFAEKLKNQVPDQGLVTTSNVTSTMLESKSSSYMQINDLITQLNEQIWSALNMPKSMISGESHSSYASELVISNYVEHKVVQVASRAKEVILANMKLRLLKINSEFPTERLDVRIELEIASSQLEKFRQAAIMATLHSFTDDEIRDFLGWQTLTEEQREHIIQTSGFGNNFPGQGTAQYPETPESSGQHSTDSGKARINRAERTPS